MSDTLVLATGEVTRVATFDHDGSFTISEAQDVEPILERNKALANAGDGFTPSRDMKYIAEIPLVVAAMWANMYGVNVLDKNHAPAVRRLLNSNEWRYLRTSPGLLRR